MEVPYSEKRNSFVPEPARPWSEKPILFNVFDMSPGGKRAIISIQKGPEGEAGELHAGVPLRAESGEHGREVDRHFLAQRVELDRDRRRGVHAAIPSARAAPARAGRAT